MWPQVSFRTWNEFGVRRQIGAICLDGQRQYVSISASDHSSMRKAISDISVEEVSAPASELLKGGRPKATSHFPLARSSLTRLSNVRHANSHDLHVHGRIIFHRDPIANCLRVRPYVRPADRRNGRGHASRCDPNRRSTAETANNPAPAATLQRLS